MMRMGAAIAAVALVLSACGGERSGTGAPEQGGGTPRPTAATTVRVELTEYEVMPDVSTVPAGTVTFEVTNLGETVHSFSVLRTDLPVDDLPVSSFQSVDITDPRIEVVAHTAILGEGEARSLETQLAPGSYVLLDNNTPYAKGMYTSFQVR